MKTKTYFLFFLLFSFTAIQAQIKTEDKKADDKPVGTKILNTTTTTEDSIVFRDNDGNTLIKITDEGTVGSITIPSGSSIPSTIVNKLYNVGSTLFFSGNPILGSGGATSLNDLSDAKYDGESLFLGEGAGDNDGFRCVGWR